MAGTSEGSKKGWETRRANKARADEAFSNRSAGQRKRRERERAAGIPQLYRVLTLSETLNEYLHASYRDIQRTILRDSAALFEIYDFISIEIEELFDMVSGGVTERWDENYQHPTGQRRTFEFEMWRDDDIAYEILYFGGVMRKYKMPEDFDIDSLQNVLKSVGVWE